VGIPQRRSKNDLVNRLKPYYPDLGISPLGDVALSEGIKMKLLFCNQCHDIVKMRFEERFCFCGKVKGRYLEDGHRAEYSGEGAVPLGMDNHEFTQTLKQWPNWKHSRGLRFDAFFIGKNCKTFVNLDAPAGPVQVDPEIRQIADREKIVQEVIAELIKNGVLTDP